MNAASKKILIADDDSSVRLVLSQAFTRLGYQVRATGNATILAAKGKASVALVPDGDNRLKGTGNYASTPDMKAIISFTAKGQPPETARFTPLLKSKEAHMDHNKH